MGLQLERSQKQNILEKALSVGPSAILRPLCISNMAKVYIIKWSQNSYWVAKSPTSGLPKDLKIRTYPVILNFF